MKYQYQRINGNPHTMKRLVSAQHGNPVPDQQ